MIALLSRYFSKKREDGEGKLRIIEMFWKVAYADGRLDSHEDYLIHKLGKLLRLSHKQLIDAKLKTKNQAS